MALYMENRNVFGAELKVLELSIVSLRWSGKEFQASGPAIENT